MFLKLDNQQVKNYTDNTFGAFLSYALNNHSDCLLVFRKHIFLVINDEQPGTFSGGVFKISKKDNVNYTFEGDFSVTEIDIQSYKYIGYKFMCEMRKIYADLNDINFPFKEVTIGIVDDYQDCLFKVEKKIKNKKQNPLSKKSKIIAEILRHDPYKYDLEISEKGWVSVNDILKNVSAIKSFETLLDIVKKDSKQRYSFNEDQTLIRANQGHSLDCVNIDFKRVYPTGRLFHGTSPLVVENIQKEGLKPMNRQYVHLSGDVDTAYSVGKRYSKNKEPVIFEINNLENLKIFQSENNVYLVENVSPTHLKILD